MVKGWRTTPVVVFVTFHSNGPPLQLRGNTAEKTTVTGPPTGRDAGNSLRVDVHFVAAIAPAAVVVGAVAVAVAVAAFDYTAATRTPL